MNDREKIIKMEDAIKKVKFCLNLQIKAIEQDLDTFSKENIIKNIKEILGFFDEFDI